MSELSVASIVARREAQPSRLSPEAEALRRQLRRLALDVHDGPMQSLIAAGYGLRDLQRHPAAENLPERLADIVTELAGAEESLRQLITTLEREGEEVRTSLESIVAEEVARFRRSNSAAVDLSLTSGIHPDSHSQEIAFRSVVREALSNIAKHANARTVGVSVQANEFGIRLEVRDDGDGFDPASVPAGCIGLESMRERLAFLDGTFAIESRPGGPTKVSAHFRRWRGDNT